MGEGAVGTAASAEPDGAGAGALGLHATGAGGAGAGGAAASAGTSGGGNGGGGNGGDQSGAQDVLGIHCSLSVGWVVQSLDPEEAVGMALASASCGEVAPRRCSRKVPCQNVALKFAVCDADHAIQALRSCDLESSRSDSYVGLRFVATQ